MENACPMSQLSVMVRKDYGDIQTPARIWATVGDAMSSPKWMNEWSVREVKCSWGDPVENIGTSQASYEGQNRLRAVVLWGHVWAFWGCGKKFADCWCISGAREWILVLKERIGELYSLFLLPSYIHGIELPLVRNKKIIRTFAL